MLFPWLHDAWCSAYDCFADYCFSCKVVFYWRLYIRKFSC